MYSINAFKVLSAFNDLVMFNKIDIKESDVEHIKLIDDGFRISYYSVERDELTMIAERIADGLHCENCIYEAIPGHWENYHDGRLELYVTDEQIPITIMVDFYGINVYTE